MSGLGVHFALTDSQIGQLRSFEDDVSRLEHLLETIEETYLEQFPEFTAQSDKAWDALHRALSDGELTWDGGEYPLNHVVLGGELLYSGDDYIMSLKSARQVRDIAAALIGITESEFRKQYDRIDPASYGADLGDDDFEYTWEGFEAVRTLFQKAAEADRNVLFTADL